VIFDAAKGRRRGDRGTDMSSSSNKSGTHLLPILLVSMVLLVAAFIVLVATRADAREHLTVLDEPTGSLAMGQ